MAHLPTIKTGLTFTVNCQPVRLCWKGQFFNKKFFTMFSLNMTSIFDLLHLKIYSIRLCPHPPPPSPPLDNIWAIKFVWRLRGNIIRTAPCWVVWQCSQSAAHSHKQFLQVQQIGFVTLGPLRHAYRRLPRVVLLVLLLVIWPVKIVPNMTYNVFGGTLNLAQSLCLHLHPSCKHGN